VRDENRPGIYVLLAGGKELGYIKTELPTNVGFGRGDEAKRCTSPPARACTGSGLNREGYHLPRSGASQ
jgi:hypothetical protein